MTNEEIVSFWANDSLRRWPESSLRDVKIPRSSKRFLAEVGLPYKEDWTLRFDANAEQLPRLPTKSNFLRIGFDDVVPICLDELRGGCVVAVETALGGTERFINSSVERFGGFLALYQQYRKAARAVSEEEILKLIPTVEERMRKTDLDAFDDPNNYWPVIIDQMNHGLL